MIRQSYQAPKVSTQRDERFNDAILKSKPSISINAKVDTDIARELQVNTKTENFSYKLSSSVVTNRFKESDFDIFMPPTARSNGYNS
jgi:hypothetical protein